ncbi:MAG: hypothetical protein EOP34_07255 [Rickettsiales bacterium]|nr:MAG: hypothetical protein EOP34_07255 [Rickettsiales bacterium]
MISQRFCSMHSKELQNFGASMNKFITKENPIIFLPKLAKIIGANESLILSLIHFWINPKYNKNFKNNRYWVYNTYSQWQDQLPHLSESTIKRTINKLEKQNILISQNFSSNPYIKLKWYSINYDALHKILPENLIHSFVNEDKENLQKAEIDEEKLFTLHSIDQISRANCTDDRLNLNRSYIETKDSTKITNNSFSISDKCLEFTQIKQLKIKENNFLVEIEMINIWNKIFKEERPKLEIDSYNIKLFQFPKIFFSRNLDLWQDYCEKIISSKFLMGEGPNKWKADVTWMAKETNIRKVLSGAYTLGDREIFFKEKTLSRLSKEDEDIIDPIWRGVTDRLKISLGKNIHNNWISKLRYVDYDRTNSKVNIIAPTNFIKEWIETYYISMITKAFKEIGIKIKYVDIIVDYKLSNQQYNITNQIYEMTNNKTLEETLYKS